MYLSGHLVLFYLLIQNYSKYQKMIQKTKDFPLFAMQTIAFCNAPNFRRVQ